MHSKIRLLLIFFTISLLCAHTAYAQQEKIPPELKGLLYRIQHGDQMDAYRAAAELTKLEYYHAKAEQVIFSVATDPNTPEGTRLFLFKAHGRQVSLGGDAEEGINKLLPFLGKFGTFSDPVLEAMIFIGPKSLPYLAKLLHCEILTTKPSDSDILIDPGHLASTIYIIVSENPKAQEIDQISLRLLECLTCTPRNTAVLCAQVLSFVQAFQPKHRNALIDILYQSQDLMIKSLSAQLLAHHQKKDSYIRPELEKALRSKNDGVRLSAAIALYRYFSRHVEAKKTLEAIAKSSNREFRNSALQVLQEN